MLGSGTKWSTGRARRRASLSQHLVEAAVGATAAPPRSTPTARRAPRSQPSRRRPGRLASRAGLHPASRGPPPRQQQALRDNRGHAGRHRADLPGRAACTASDRFRDGLEPGAGPGILGTCGPPWAPLAERILGHPRQPLVPSVQSEGAGEIAGPGWDRVPLDGPLPRRPGRYERSRSGVHQRDSGGPTTRRGSKRRAYVQRASPRELSSGDQTTGMGAAGKARHCWPPHRPATGRYINHR